MGGRMMRTLVAIAAVVVLAGTIGTAVYAMVDDEPDGPAALTPHRSTDDAGGGGGAVAAICAEGVPDCEDMVVDEDGGAAGGTCLEGSTECVDNPGDFRQCATEEPCDDFAECAPDMVCIEPWLMDPPVCPDGVSVEGCFPDGIPAGYECLTLESFPVQIKCYPIACAPVDGGPVTILPAPGDDGVTTLPAPADPDAPVDEPQIDPAPSVVEEPVLPTEPCLPGDCAEDPDGVMICKPIDDPCSPEPDPNVRCLPPDCAVSSDGSVSCPEPLPVPCAVPGDDVPRDLPICEIPPATGAGCPPGLTPEECARIDPPSQGGGSSPGSPGIEIDVQE